MIIKKDCQKIIVAVKGNGMGVLKSVRNRFQKKRLFKACEKGDESTVFAMLREAPELAESKDYRGQ